MKYKNNIVSIEHVENIKKINDDDAVEAYVIRELNVSSEEAWNIIDKVWEKFGRD